MEGRSRRRGWHGFVAVMSNACQKHSKDCFAWYATPGKDEEKRVERERPDKEDNECGFWCALPEGNKRDDREPKDKAMK